MSWFSNLFKGKQDDSLLAVAYQWGEERAVVALNSFNYLQESYPEMPQKELYYTALSSFGITESVARDIVDDASDVNEGSIGFGLKLPSIKAPFGLRSVVYQLLIREECERFGFKGFPHRYGMIKAFNAVDDVIPENL